jgi:uncharacterized protein YjaG (DUF416 family)
MTPMARMSQRVGRADINIDVLAGVELPVTVFHVRRYGLKTMHHEATPDRLDERLTEVQPAIDDCSTTLGGNAIEALIDVVAVSVTSQWILEELEKREDLSGGVDEERHGASLLGGVRLRVVFPLLKKHIEKRTSGQSAWTVRQV